MDYRKFAAITLFFCYVQLSMGQNGKIDSSIVMYWAKRIGEETHKFAEEVMATSALKKEYQSLGLDIERVNGTKLAAELAGKLEEFFKQKRVALKNLAEEAEKVQREFVDDGQELTYYQAKDLQGLILKDDPNFGVPINTSASMVHIPTEVYDKGPKVARDIKWTKKLNDVFRNNFEKYPDLSWQYFGSAEGIHRQYPARQWPKPENGPDLYDARRRPWYIQGASSPKDVVILIDRSGSLLGLRTEIAKLAASVIVETLSTNDFFQVVLFNNESNFICCDEFGPMLLQATRGNKEYVKYKLKSLKATSTANWRAGLEMAFELLKTARERKQGTNCQQALLILSDGSAIYEEDIFQKYNLDKKIRVFTFVVGPPQYGVAELREMACKNQGYFQRIPSVGTVWETVTSYIRVLSRPVGKALVKPTVFTSVFVDATGGGLVSTGSTPVFQYGNGTARKLLGVMATDVPVRDMSEFIYFPLTGHNGYVFAIDNNGLILIHPGINGEKLGKLVPQPNMDLDELEFAVSNSSEVEELRKNMILTTEGSIRFEAYIKSADELRVRKNSMEYHYFRPKSSPFSIGITSPEYGYIIKKPKISYLQGKIALESVNKVKKWPYCAKIRNDKDLIGKIVKKLDDAYKQGVPPLRCDLRMLNGLLLDANVTLILPKIWVTKEDIRAKNMVTDVFVRTNWGVVRYSNASLPYSENTTLAIEADLAVSPWDYYSRAVRQQDDILTITVPSNVGPNPYEPRISIYAPVRLDKPSIAVAVTGLEMNYSYFADNYFIKQTYDCPGGLPCDSRLTCDRTQKNEIQGLYCYLLDENGFIVSSNEEKDTGKFFGVVDPKVMAKLLVQKNISNSIGIFEVVTLPDYQASCKLVPADESSAETLLSPIKSMANLVLWFSSSLITTLSQFTLHGFMGLFSRSVADDGQEEEVQYISCVKNTTMYLADTSNMDVSYSGNASCEVDNKCSRNFMVARVPKTNLYLLVVKSTCGKCKTGYGIDLPGVPGESKEIIYNEAIYIKPSNKTKVRREPSECFPPEKESDGDCAGAASLLASYSLLLTCVTLAILWKL